MLSGSGTLKQMSTLMSPELFCLLALMQKLLTCFLPISKQVSVHSSLLFLCKNLLAFLACPPQNILSLFVAVLWSCELSHHIFCNPNERFHHLGWWVVQITHFYNCALNPSSSCLFPMMLAFCVQAPGTWSCCFHRRNESFIPIENLGSPWYYHKNGVLNLPGRS